MPVAVDSLSSTELTRLIAAAQKRKKILAKRKPARVVRKKLETTAKAHGYSLEELFGTPAAAVAAATRPAKRRGGSTAKVPPKYRDPSNPENTWTGRGRTPLWMVAYLEAGQSREDFLIERQPPAKEAAKETPSPIGGSGFQKAEGLSAAGAAAAAHIEDD